MDQANRFETRTTYRLIRLEYLIGLAVSITLFVLHRGEVRWLPAVVLFVYIDLIGYLPGAIAYHRSQTKRISKVYYLLYNSTHSLATQSAVVGVWVLLAGWEWALLAIPIHLFGDRALFGNFLKPFAVPFEPATHPAFAKLSAEIERPAWRPSPPAPAAVADREPA